MRDDEDGIILQAGDGEQITFFRIGSHYKALASLRFTESADHPAAHYGKRRHRLGGDAGFGDHIDQRVCGRDRVQRVANEIRVDVIQHQETFAGIRPSESGIQSRRPQGGSTDAQEKNVRVRVGAREVGHRLHSLVIERQGAEAKLSGCMCALNALYNVFRRLRGLFKCDLRYAMTVAYHSFKHVGVIEFEQTSSLLPANFHSTSFSVRPLSI